MRPFFDLLTMLLVLASTQATTVLRHRVKRSIACGAEPTISAAVCATHTRQRGSACQMCGPNLFDERDSEYLNKCVGRKKHCISAEKWSANFQDNGATSPFGLRSLDELRERSSQRLNDLLSRHGQGELHEPSQPARPRANRPTIRVESVFSAVGGGRAESKEESKQHVMDAQADANDVEKLAREAEADLVALSNMHRTCMMTLFNAGPSPPLMHAMSDRLDYFCSNDLLFLTPPTLDPEDCREREGCQMCGAGELDQRFLDHLNQCVFDRRNCISVDWWIRKNTQAQQGGVPIAGGVAVTKRAIMKEQARMLRKEARRRRRRRRNTNGGAVDNEG